MSFADSAEDVRLHDGHILYAQLYNANGELRNAEIDLDDLIGNSNGHFEWGGQGFSESAEQISFNFEGEANVPVLRAHLKDENGDLVPRDINLAERISNSDGNFEFVR